MGYDKELVAGKLRRWERYMDHYKLPAWEDIPDFGLYMEQVTALLKEYLDYLPPELKEEQFITPATINNYVRKRVMPEPVKKKYYRIHIVYLIIICTLKQSLSIATGGALRRRAPRLLRRLPEMAPHHRPVFLRAGQALRRVRSGSRGKDRADRREHGGADLRFGSDRRILPAACRKAPAFERRDSGVGRKHRAGGLIPFPKKKKPAEIRRLFTCRETHPDRLTASDRRS